MGVDFDECRTVNGAPRTHTARTRCRTRWWFSRWCLISRFVRWDTRTQHRRKCVFYRPDGFYHTRTPHYPHTRVSYHACWTDGGWWTGENIMQHATDHFTYTPLPAAYLLPPHTPLHAPHAHPPYLLHTTAHTFLFTPCPLPYSAYTLATRAPHAIPRTRAACRHTPAYLALLPRYARLPPRTRALHATFLLMTHCHATLTTSGAVDANGAMLLQRTA